MKRIILKDGAEHSIKRGHPWVWDNEIEAVLEGAGAKAVDSALLPGEIADVESAPPAGQQHGAYLGRAFVNPHSKITARIYSPSKEGLDAGFFKRRIAESLERRTAFYDLSRESCRAVFAEADFLPGLIIDRFVGWAFSETEPLPAPLSFESVEKSRGKPLLVYVIQLLTRAMDDRRGFVTGALLAIEKCAIYEKSLSSVRALEGLSPCEGAVSGFPLDGVSSRLLIFEDGIPFVIDFAESQKTGHFLDQAHNRAAAGRIAASLSRAAQNAGREPPRVLDCFCYTGGFSMQAARSGAFVTACDSSEAALKSLEQNAALAGLSDNIEARKTDVFDALSGFARQKEKFDMIILDPPAFAKTAASKNAALRAYRELNLKAFSLLKKGGVLVTCSCSGAVSEWVFRRIIEEAARDAGLYIRGRRIRQAAFCGQSPDHPVLLGYDESLYLKCGVYTVW